MATEDAAARPERAPDGQAWWQQGEEPDYRATLANERTFLAWTRTALGMFAGALAVLQLHQLAPFPLRLALACYLIALAAATTVVGYLQWRTRQGRMRLRRPLGQSPTQVLLTVALLALGCLVAAVVGCASR
ncbi:YidH family protein [Streptacidiphilus cavernicola]|uniref:YidH family protein n=1 Tax=Streptacidiphilus cavernicola TaxID=3342716 RepID=A0ABV6VVM1_9ACTN